MKKQAEKLLIVIKIFFSKLEIKKHLTCLMKIKKGIFQKILGIAGDITKHIIY